eukprot:1525891-Karenia_brevis.AAC.1
MEAFLNHFLGPVPENVTRLDEAAEDQDQDEAFQATVEAFLSRVPLESSILPSTVDNIAELIEQRSIGD